MALEKLFPELTVTHDLASVPSSRTARRPRTRSSTPCQRPRHSMGASHNPACQPTFLAPLPFIFSEPPTLVAERRPASLSGRCACDTVHFHKKLVDVSDILSPSMSAFHLSTASFLIFFSFASRKSFSTCDNFSAKSK